LGEGRRGRWGGGGADLVKGGAPNGVPWQKRTQVWQNAVQIARVMTRKGKGKRSLSVAFRGPVVQHALSCPSQANTHLLLFEEG